jgi:hypothetical protein
LEQFEDDEEREQHQQNTDTPQGKSRLATFGRDERLPDLIEEQLEIEAQIFTSGGLRPPILTDECIHQTFFYNKPH